MPERLLETEARIARPLHEVFEFFSDARNLAKITPPRLGFRMLTPHPVVMKEGALIDYRIKLLGFPVRWRTLISAWEPPFRFVDEQLVGPYRRWVHEHSFADDGRGGTTMKDRVSYAVPFDFLVHRLWVGPDVRRVFDYRNEAIRALFP